MLSRRSLFKSLVVASAVPALALPAEVAAVVPLAQLLDSECLGLVEGAMGRLGLIDLPLGETVSASDYRFVKQFARPGIKAHELAKLIAPYYFGDVRRLG